MVVSRRRKQEEADVRPTKKDVEQVETKLRPSSLSEYVGQQDIKDHLGVYLQAAIKRSEPLGHTILHGPPGLGKTTLAAIVAREMGLPTVVAVPGLLAKVKNGMIVRIDGTTGLIEILAES